MARSVLLLRHAKSSWADPALADYERPLARRGIRAAERMGRHLRSGAVRPQLVLCSSARRARETLDLVLTKWGHHVDVHVDDDLYGADARQLLARLRRVDGAVSSVMVVGHNPGLQDLAISLCANGDEHALQQLHTKFPTGALATLEFDVADWGQLAFDGAVLVDLVLPKQLG